MSNNDSSESGTKKWIIIGAIVGIIAVTFAGISTFHLFGSDTTQPIVIVKVNSTDQNTGGSITGVTTHTTNGTTNVNLLTSSSLVDDFYSDTSLNQLLWIQDGPLIKAWTSSNKLVLPYVTFQSSGMYIDNIRNQFDTAGIETTNAYSPPFTLTTQFQGPTAQFTLADPNGNHHTSFAATTMGSCDMNFKEIELSSNSWTEIKTTQQIQNWCTVKITVDALGTGSFTIEDKSTPISIGKGPFHILIAKAQYNQNPDSQPTFWRYIHLIPNSTP